MTTPVRIVLATLHANDGPMYGLELARATGLGAGTVYPLLHRLAGAGWVASVDEFGPHPSRPARRFWAVTEKAPRP
jgi:DNA-binding PadR family transcriptional regulator